MSLNVQEHTYLKEEKKESPNKNAVNDVDKVAKKVGKVTITEPKKEGAEGEKPRKPTLRKKSMKKKKMSDEEIMANLRKLVSSADPKTIYDIKKRVGSGYVLWPYIMNSM